MVHLFINGRIVIGETVADIHLQIYHNDKSAVKTSPTMEEFEEMLADKVIQKLVSKLTCVEQK